MHHAISNEHVRHNHLRSVNEYSAVSTRADGQVVLVVFGPERCAIHEVGGVVHVLDDVVLEDSAQVLARQVGEGGSDGAEGFVVGREDGDVARGSLVDGLRDVYRAVEGGQVERERGDQD